MAGVRHEHNDLDKRRRLVAARAELEAARADVDDETTKALLTIAIDDVAAAEYAHVSSVVSYDPFDRRCAADAMDALLRRIAALAQMADAMGGMADPAVSLKEKHDRTVAAVAAIHELAFCDRTGD